MKIVPSNEGMIIRGNTFRDTIGCPGLWFDNTPGGLTIENNKFINNSPDAPTQQGLMIEVTSGSAGDPIIVRNNIFERNGMYVSASNYVYIYNNIFDNGSVTLHGIGGERLSVSNNRIINNIFYLTGPPPVYPMFIVYDPPAPFKADNNVSDYNIFYDTSSSFGSSSMVFGGDFAWNNGVTYLTWQSRGFDTHSIIGDPLFTNASAGDYTLQTGSPALGAGLVNSYVPIDIRGIGRSGVNDIGAYQISSAVITPNPLTSNTTTNPTTPTPVTPNYSSSAGSSAQSQVNNLLAMGQYTLAQQIASQYGISIPPNMIPGSIIMPAPIPTPTPSPAQTLLPAISVSRFPVGNSPVDKKTVYVATHISAPVVSPTGEITRNLNLNDPGEDVRILQQVLNHTGYTIAVSGKDSPGNETTIFDSATAKALKNYQTDREASGLIPSGKLDNITLVLINADIQKFLIDPTAVSVSAPVTIFAPTTNSPVFPAAVNWLQQFVQTVVGYLVKVTS